jgi:sugar/nucleoside kinase (ribokinase family)
MPPPADVLVVGDALLDVHVVPVEPMRSGGDVPAAVRVGPGGQGANVAVRLARRGVRVRLACALGDDASSRLVREAIEAEGIVLEVTPAEATGAVVILLDADGERTMLSRRAPLLPRTVDAAAWTVVSGYALLEEGELELVGDGRRGILGCAVPAGSEAAWWQRARALRPDVVILNADEARALGADARSMAAEAGALLVVTGPNGAVATRADPADEERRATVERVASVDTTGTGDAFAAAFLAELHGVAAWADADLDRALAAGLELAALVAGVSGAQAAVPIELGRAPV